ncbi:MAG: 50S ribosomal protein L4 [Clostridiales bacterium]|jgi:large subunit ribosomal protein L4|nr:50S ribosomal protein L4 [Clostridiales bacterium]
MKQNVYDIKGNIVGDIELNDAIFGAEYNESLIHQVIVAQLANKRQGTQSNLTRAEVRGGGRKPYRQKGTGRARQGSTRSPQWTKGGIVFAKKPRDFSQKLNKRAKEEALKSALAAKVADGNFIVLNEIKLTQPKTKELAAVLKAFKIDKKTLLVTLDKDDTVVRSGNNIEILLTTTAELINVYDIVSNTKFIITADAVKKIEGVYA